jgi:ribonuclease BN (tRNA processing enzyme)
VGGNSSCVEVVAAGRRLIFDAGTGIIELGRQMMREGSERSAHIFLSHAHHDHIEGLRFFEPAYSCDWKFHLYGPGSGPGVLRDIFKKTMEPHLFPVSLEELPAKVHIEQLGAFTRLKFGSKPTVTVTARHSRAHPKVGVMLYRVACAGRSVVYASDIESPLGGYEDVVDLARGADLLIHDAQYTDPEYHGGRVNKAGWGHSTVRMAAEVARDAEVGKLVLYHHDPTRTDAQVSRLEQLARSIFPRTEAAREGMELRLRAV